MRCDRGIGKNWSEDSKLMKKNISHQLVDISEVSRVS